MLVDSYNISGDKVGSFELPKEIFGVEPHKGVLHEVLVAELASFRQGSAATKTRSMVRGGGRKPYRQKGTGRARQGSIRSPQWVGGGTVFGPSPRDHSKKVNKKVRKLALRSALSEKAKAGEVAIIDSLNLESSKTKEARTFINKVCDPSTLSLFIIENIFEHENFYLAFRNLQESFVVESDSISIYLLLKSKKLLFSKESIEYLKEVLI